MPKRKQPSAVTAGPTPPSTVQQQPGAQPGAAGQPAQPAQPQEERDDGVDEGVSTEVFEAYECKSLKIGKAHPGAVAEAQLLASVPLPPCTYPTDALDKAIEAGKLSNLQLEGALYACQRHQRILPGGKRQGFFLADGTGQLDFESPWSLQ